MEVFRRQFLLESVKNIKQLKNKFPNAEIFSDSERREILRTLHTIKGSAQTFGFTAAGAIAHELENLLSAGQITNDESFQKVFFEGLTLLTSALERENSELPAQFIKKIRSIVPSNSLPQNVSNISLPNIPLEIMECLSQTEKISIDSALKLGKSIYCFEVAFKTISFADDLINCRAKLADAGEIIATFPGAHLNSDSKIGFKILCASAAEKTRFEEIAKLFGAEITLDIYPKNFTKDLNGIISKVVAHGRELAEKCGKNIDFEVFADEIELSDEKLKLVFDILIHLIRNAVDHGIKNNKGTIEISSKSENDGLILSVADDGNGIDVEKLKSRAIERKIISPTENIDVHTTFDLVFQSELSTAPEVTEISGRGVGLDAVKTLVEKSGGTIKVKSSSEKGTVFETFLPL